MKQQIRGSKDRVNRVESDSYFPKAHLGKQGPAN